MTPQNLTSSSHDTLPPLRLPLSEAFAPAARDGARVGTTRPSLSYWKDAWLRLKRNKQAIFSLWLIVALVLFAAVGPLFWTVSTSKQELGRNSEPASFRRRMAVVVAPAQPFVVPVVEGVPEKVQGIDATVLAAPAELSIEGTPTTERVRLRWTPVPDASGYAIYRSNAEPRDFTELGVPVGETRAGNRVGFEDTIDLKPEATYYSVVAKNATGAESTNHKTLKIDLHRTITVEDAEALGLDATPGASVKLPLRPFGTDSLGRDQLARMMEGGRVSLFVGFFSALLATFLGIMIGGISGYFGGKVDLWLMRFTDFILALPFLLFMIVFRVASGTQPGESGVVPMMIALVVLSWTGPARLVRGQVLQLRETEFVQASRLLGAKPLYLITRHLLPNTLGVVLVSLTFAIPSAIFTEAFLSFIGMGVVPPTPSWGQMCDEGTRIFLEHPHVFFFPALFISMSVLAFNLLGDGMRDAFDPRMRSVQ